VPAVVRKSRRPRWREAAAVGHALCPIPGAAQRSTPRAAERVASARDDRKSATVAKRNRRPSSRSKAAAEVFGEVTSPPGGNEAARSVARPAANDDRKPAIMTIRRRGKRFADAPDMTPEEHRRRGDAADALFRRVTGRDP
jgi:hypothetical protein